MMIMDTGLTVKVSGKNYPVTLTGSGQFSVHLGDENDVSAPSMGELEDKLRGLKLTRFELEITTPGNRDATITGFHASTGNLLIRWTGGSHSQEYPSRLEGSMPRLDAAGKAELAALLKARTDAEEAWKMFVKERRYPSIQDAADEARRLAGGAE